MPNVTVNDAAIQLLYDNLATLPSKEYGTINMLPFAHDTETTRTVKRQVCEAIIELLDNNGYIKTHVPQPERLVQSVATVRCKACHETIIQLSTDPQGSANVVASLFISDIASRNVACPHGVVTSEDLRQHLEDQFRATMAEEEATMAAARAAVSGESDRRDGLTQ